MPAVFVRNLRARRYALRIERDGTIRVTVPRGGSRAAALDFARRNAGWIVRQRFERLRHSASEIWTAGSDLLLRGARVALRAQPHDEGRLAWTLGDEIFAVAREDDSVNVLLQRHLHRLAIAELIPRCRDLAAQHGVLPSQIRVANQRSLWGSCSGQGAIRLNWRLIQMPDHVRDYVILHELMHLRELNHSRRFWTLVERACPGHRDARRWLKQHQTALI
jgi:predicted metal-dependent hydrolase